MSAVFEAGIDPHVAARQSRHLQGTIAVAKLERLVEALQRDVGSADVDVKFELGDNGRIEFELAINAEVIAQCQRCLGDVQFAVSSRRRMAVVTEQSAVDDLPEELEPVMVLGNTLKLIPVIEDELILSLPIVIKHDVCQPAVELAPEDDLDSARENPFAVLKQLKAKDTS